MPIQRHVKKVEIAPGLIRYRVIVTGEPCPSQTHEARIHLSIFLNWISDNQSLLECGYSSPQKITITHNDTCWQVEAEAEVEESSG